MRQFQQSVKLIVLVQKACNPTIGKLPAWLNWFVL
jgi:hypothetical protein